MPTTNTPPKFKNIAPPGAPPVYIVTNPKEVGTPKTETFKPDQGGGLVGDRGTVVPRGGQVPGTPLNPDTVFAPGVPVQRPSPSQTPDSSQKVSSQVTVQLQRSGEGVPQKAAAGGRLVSTTAFSIMQSDVARRKTGSFLDLFDRPTEQKRQDELRGSDFITIPSNTIAREDKRGTKSLFLGPLVAVETEQSRKQAAQTREKTEDVAVFFTEKAGKKSTRPGIRVAKDFVGDIARGVGGTIADLQEPITTIERKPLSTAFTIASFGLGKALKTVGGPAISRITPIISKSPILKASLVGGGAVGVGTVVGGLAGRDAQKFAGEIVGAGLVIAPLAVGIGAAVGRGAASREALRTEILLRRAGTLEIEGVGITQRIVKPTITEVAVLNQQGVKVGGVVKKGKTALEFGEGQAVKVKADNSIFKIEYKSAFSKEILDFQPKISTKTPLSEVGGGKVDVNIYREFPSGKTVPVSSKTYFFDVRQREAFGRVKTFLSGKEASLYGFKPVESVFARSKAFGTVKSAKFLDIGIASRRGYRTSAALSSDDTLFISRVVSSKRSKTPLGGEVTDTISNIIGTNKRLSIGENFDFPGLSGRVRFKKTKFPARPRVDENKFPQYPGKYNTPLGRVRFKHLKKFGKLKEPSIEKITKSSSGLFSIVKNVKSSEAKTKGSFGSSDVAALKAAASEVSNIRATNKFTNIQSRLGGRQGRIKLRFKNIAIQGVIPSTLSRSAIRSFSRTTGLQGTQANVLTGIPEYRTVDAQSIIQVPSQTTRQRQDIVSLTITGQRQRTTQASGGGQGFGFSSPTPIVPPPPFVPIPGFRIPEVDGRVFGRSPRFKSGRKYRPSAFAIEFGIRSASKALASATLSGLEVRPILSTGQRRRKRR